MNRILIEQNPWWENPDAINNDKDIREYANAQVQFRLPSFSPKSGVHILRGPRQVGKTTLVKTLIRDRLAVGKSDGVFYFSAESGLPIETAIREYLDFSGSKEKLMIIDEATEDVNWASKIKYLVDIGKITKNDLLVVTGSSSIDLKRGSERLPGRFVEGNEQLFYPYSFRDCAAYTGNESGILDFNVQTAKKVYLSETLRKGFFGYIRNGGLPPVWNTERELARERYARWAEGLLSRHGKSLIYAKEILARLGEKTTFDFLGISNETSIKSHHTVESYISFFEAGMFGKLVYNYSLSVNAPDTKKEKKFIFLDPFFTEVLSRGRGESFVVEDIVGSHLLRVCDNLYFLRDKKGEIDFICDIEGTIVPVEVKWQNDVSKADAAHLQKFGKGFIITKDTVAVFGKIIAVPAFVFLAMIGRTMVKRRVL